MTVINRNPDVKLHERERTPAGHYLHEGKLLMATARAAGIPYGLCLDRVYQCGTSKKSRVKTIGLIIRNEDRKRFEEYLLKKLNK